MHRCISAQMHKFIHIYIHKYIYVYTYAYIQNIKNGPLNSCSPRAARVQSFDFDFTVARRSEDSCRYIYIYICGWENYVLCGSGVGELCAMWFRCGRIMCYVVWERNVKNSSRENYVLCGLSHLVMQLFVGALCAMWPDRPHST